MKTLLLHIYTRVENMGVAFRAESCAYAGKVKTRKEPDELMRSEDREFAITFVCVCVLWDCKSVLKYIWFEIYFVTAYLLFLLFS